MNVARPALVALLVGLALLGSPAVLLQFQEPAECSTDVQPADDFEEAASSAPEFRYDELSPAAKRAFDQAKSARSSVTVTGENCPAEFEYGPGRTRYVVVQDDARYVLTTYQGDLLPEVPIAAGVLAYLGLALAGLGVVARNDPDARFPTAIGLVGATALLAVTAAVVLDQQLWPAVGWAGLVTGGAFVGIGATLAPRDALLLGGSLTVLPAIALLPLTGASVLFLAPAVLPLLLVGVGVAAGQFGRFLQAE